MAILIYLGVLVLLSAGLLTYCYKKKKSPSELDDSNTASDSNEVLLELVLSLSKHVKDLEEKYKLICLKINQDYKTEGNNHAYTYAKDLAKKGVPLGDIMASTGLSESEVTLAASIYATSQAGGQENSEKGSNGRGTIQSIS